MEPSAEPTKQRSAWQLVLTGVLLAGGALAFAPLALLGFFGFLDCGPEADPCLAVAAYVSLAIFVGIPLTVAGGLVALATTVPVGRFRRVVIGLGAAIAAGVVTVVLIERFGTGTSVINGQNPVVVIAIVSAVVFYLSYRVAR